MITIRARGMVKNAATNTKLTERGFGAAINLPKVLEWQYAFDEASVLKAIDGLASALERFADIVRHTNDDAESMYHTVTVFSSDINEYEEIIGCDDNDKMLSLTEDLKKLFIDGPQGKAMAAILETVNLRSFTRNLKNNECLPLSIEVVFCVQQTPHYIGIATSDNRVLMFR